MTSAYLDEPYTTQLLHNISHIKLSFVINVNSGQITFEVKVLPLDRVVPHLHSVFPFLN